MSEDIKEILLFLEFTKNEDIKRQWLFKDEAILLLDYITNLQQYYNDNVNKYEELLVKYSDLQEENERLNNIINKVIKYIKEHCIDDEFYINLSNKEKGIIDVLTILENGSDKYE